MTRRVQHHLQVGSAGKHRVQGGGEDGRFTLRPYGMGVSYSDREERICSGEAHASAGTGISDIKNATSTTRRRAASHSGSQ